RVQAPDAFEQALPAQHLVTPRDAAAEIIGDVEECGIAVGDLRGQCHQVAVDGTGMCGLPESGEQFDGAFGPYAPVAEQSAFDAYRDVHAVAGKDERDQQIEHDVVVVAGIERDAVFGARGDDSADDVERSISIEGSDLDRHDLVNLRETPPETVWQ